VTPADPLVSVVIASVNGLPAIAECLDALARQEGGPEAEVLVVDRCGEETRRALRGRFPDVQVIAADAGTSVPALRALGMARAKGRMIAVLEDHCNVERGWLRAIARQREAGALVVGGAVENGSVERTVDWAAFFCEYARFMPPVPRGVVREITGNNSVYDRAALARLGPEAGAEVWESFLHERMRVLGVPFQSDPDLVVIHKKSEGYLHFLAQRYHYSRSFAGMRLHGSPWWKRVGYACATPLLPPLLMARMAATVARKRRHGARFLQSAPVLATFLLSWAWGEAVGALLGPGRSLERVE
jgi:glycosyltransferase involved in cell wall biosynthesis